MVVDDDDAVIVVEFVVFNVDAYKLSDEFGNVLKGSVFK